MGSLKTVQATNKQIELNSSPRISFSSDFLDDKNFISITPKPQAQKKDQETENSKSRNADFEFLSSNPTTKRMLTADELFFEGKLLPFWEMQYSEKLNKLSLNSDQQITEKREEKAEVMNTNKEDSRMSWFLDDDPSPRPPKCTVLWKELLKLRKQRASVLSPSSSTSSSSSSSSEHTDEGKKGTGNREKYVKRVKKGLERTRSTSLKIRPMVNVPICTQGKNNAGLPPLFSLKKGRPTENLKL